VGTSHTGAQMAAKLDKLAAELRDVDRPLNATALVGKRIFQAAAAGAGASRLVRARYDIRGNQAIIRYAGAKAHLVNNPTKAHRIEPRSRRRRGGQRQALTIDGNLRAYANHRGTRGKQFFEKARAVCETALPRVYGREQVTEPLRRIF
jgi:hypothetical protein